MDHTLAQLIKEYKNDYISLICKIFSPDSYLNENREEWLKGLKSEVFLSFLEMLSKRKNDGRLVGVFCRVLPDTTRVNQVDKENSKTYIALIKSLWNEELKQRTVSCLKKIAYRGIEVWKQNSFEWETKNQAAYKSLQGQINNLDFNTYRKACKSYNYLFSEASGLGIKELTAANCKRRTFRILRYAKRDKEYVQHLGYVDKITKLEERAKNFYFRTDKRAHQSFMRVMRVIKKIHDSKYKKEARAQRALELKEKKKQKSLVPKISDKRLKQRMNRIEWVCPVIPDLSGAFHDVSINEIKDYDLVYKESNVDPRKSAFHWDENVKTIGPAKNLKEIGKADIYITVGGYYGFAKATMAEVMSQIPKGLLRTAKAFAVDPGKEVEISGSGNYQIFSIILYGYDRRAADPSKTAPACNDLIKPLDTEKVSKLRDCLSPMLLIKNEYQVFDHSDLEKPFLKYNFGPYYRGVDSESVVVKGKLPLAQVRQKKQDIVIYQKFSTPYTLEAIYDEIINQIPAKLIKKKTIGFAISYMEHVRTKEGFVHAMHLNLVETKE